MSIQRRILAGYTVVVCLLLAPAIYALSCLFTVAEQADQSLRGGLDRLHALEGLQTEFDAAARLEGFATAFGDDPDVRARAAASFKKLRMLYARARPQFLYFHPDAEPRLDRLLGFGAARREAQALPDPARVTASTGVAAGTAAMETVAIGAAVTGATVKASAAKGTAVIGAAVTGATAKGTAAMGAAANGTAAMGAAVNRAPPDTRESAESQVTSAAGGPPWTPEAIVDARVEMLRVYDLARQRMLDETVARVHEAARAYRLSVAAVLVALALAAISTVLVLRGMRKPLRQLISATMAVSAGKFGIAVPVSGDDEVSRLTDAFNKMSESLAVFEKMSADFLSIAAHELRSPLTCIKGYVGALRAALPDDILANPEAARYLERIDREADLMADKVSELLTFGMIEAGQLQLEPREIMTEGFLMMLGEAFRPIASERGITFRVDVRGVPPYFRGDPDRLNQVLLNLLDNAFKYTHSGGEVVMEAREVGGSLEIGVVDTGPGIPAEQLDVIFEKYARVKSGSHQGHKGTGLGLAVARGIVLAHRGTIGVTSEPGKGSRFVVRLPLEGMEPKERESKQENREVA